MTCIESWVDGVPVRWQLAVACAVLAVLSGCSRHHEDKLSRARPPVYKASGVVTWNGEPASGAVVTLHSKSHNLAATGSVDAKGAFTLSTWRPGDGAVAGEHAVTVDMLVVSGTAPDGNVIMENDMPSQYRDPAKSGLTATIDEKGKNVLLLEVIGPPQIRKKR
jgi:hypothetical protein